MKIEDIISQYIISQCDTLGNYTMQNFEELHKSNLASLAIGWTDIDFEVVQWWMVNVDLADAIDEIGEPILEAFGFWLWARREDGPLYEDPILRKVLRKAHYLLFRIRS